MCHFFRMDVLDVTFDVIAFSSRPVPQNDRQLRCNQKKAELLCYTFDT